MDRGGGLKESVAIFHRSQSALGPQIHSSHMKNVHSFPRSPTSYPIIALVQVLGHYHLDQVLVWMRLFRCDTVP